MRRRVFTAVFVLLVGCAPAVPTPPEGTDYIKLFSGGAFAGLSGATIYATDVMVFEAVGPFDENPRSTTKTLKPGSYVAARTLVEQGLPKIDRDPPENSICLDYGADSIEVSPPVRGLSGVMATCPQSDLLALYDAILKAVEDPEAVAN